MSRTYKMKKHHPGGASLGYYWETEDSIVEVAEEHVMDLERASHGDIYQVGDQDFAEVVEDEEDEVEEPIPFPPEMEPTIVSDLAEATDLASPVRDRPAPKKRAPAKKAAAPKPKSE